MEVIEKVRPTDSDPSKTKSGKTPEEELHKLFNEQVTKLHFNQFEIMCHLIWHEILSIWKTLPLTMSTVLFQGYSDYVVVFLRLITSGQLQEGADFCEFKLGSFNL